MASQQTRSTNDTLGKVGTFVVGFLIFLGYKYYTSSPKVPVPAQAPQMSKEQLLMLQLQAQQQQIQQLQQQQQYNQLQNAYNNAEQQARFDSMQRQQRWGSSIPSANELPATLESAAKQNELRKLGEYFKYDRRFEK